MRLCVLKGGLSSEREVSLKTGAAVAAALRSCGHDVTEVDVERGEHLFHTLLNPRPDAVFNALHGTYGEDGCVQGMLELLRIPYTHSGVRASAVAMHKPTAKILFEAAGLRCAGGEIVTPEEAMRGHVLPPPYVLKPVAEGSSVGVVIVLEGDAVPAASSLPSGPLLAEHYISGRELSVAVLDGKALGAVEIRPKEGFYDYRNKYTSGMTEYLLPAPVDADVYREALAMAEAAHSALGCRGVTRSDIRYSDRDGRLYLLEINTHPGMTATSLVPKIAAQAGIRFEELADRLVKSARCDHGNQL